MFIKLKNLNHYGDIVAMPFFLISSVYFMEKIDKTPTEWVLLLFSFFGFILDLLYTIIYFRYK
jgi:hypothetical protein